MNLSHQNNYPNGFIIRTSQGNPPKGVNKEDTVRLELFQKGHSEFEPIDIYITPKEALDIAQALQTATIDYMEENIEIYTNVLYQDKNRRLAV